MSYLRWIDLYKTFLIGILLGIAAAAGAVYMLPAVDQHREISYVSVAPNGGNFESFHINIPFDRIMVGAADQMASSSAGVAWPSDEILAGVSGEMFKLRNERGDVVGIAARTVAEEVDTNVIDWVLHLPARGSLFFNMDAAPDESGYRRGGLRSATQEFESLGGTITERWIADESEKEDAPDGRIELQANYVGQLEPIE
jgi:hypothetical protein